MKKNIWTINVPGNNGYSFAVRTEEDEEGYVLMKALKVGLFEDNNDANYAVVEDITDSPYDIAAFANCTYDID